MGTIKELYDGVGFGRLITVGHQGGQAKLSKAEEKGYISAGLHLAPFKASGHQMCPFASDGCAKACLTFSGQGGIGLDKNNMNTCQRARIARTKVFMEQPGRFWEMFHREMEAFIRKAKRLGLKPTFRPNITSDVPWERKRDLARGKRTMFEEYEGRVQFMDYTAWPIELRRNVPDNYHLTFSLKEDNDDRAHKALGSGMCVAVAMDVKKSEPMPETWGGYPVIDGDEHDLRFLDAPGHVVGLRPKGSKAKKDKSGFIRSKDGGLSLTGAHEVWTEQWSMTKAFWRKS